MSTLDHFAQGIKLGLAGKYGEAISELTLAAEVQPASAEVLVNLGVALHKVGEDERALASYEAALKLAPRHAEAHYFRANILYGRKLMPAAMAGFAMAIGLQPGLIEAHRKPLPKDRLTDYTKAAAEIYWLFKPATRILKFDQRLLADPRQAQTYVERGSAYFELGNYEQAAADYGAAFEIEPRNARAIHYRGLAREQLGELDQALDDYNQAIKLDPNFSDPHINRGSVLGKQGKLQEAIASLTEGIRLNPADLNGYFNRGSALFRTGELDSAAADFSRVIELEPRDDGAYYWRAQAHEKAGRRQQAIADYESALRITHDPRVKESAAQQLLVLRR